MDFELEFGFFLGKKGKNIKPSESFDHIFGFTIFNDFSARDAQGLEMQSMLGTCTGKDFDTGNSMGRAEEHTSDPQSLMRLSSAVLCSDRQINYEARRSLPASFSTKNPQDRS